MTPRFTKAITLAAEAHEGQGRKGTENKHGKPIPYITHPVAVAALVARYGGDEDQQIGALLHDVLEDAGEEWAPRIAEFGERVLSIVRACTDGTPNAVTGKKAPWLERKKAYLAHLSETPDDALLVSACDKLHNIQAIHLDLTEIGTAVFERFTASQDETLWYYRSLAEIFAARKVAPAEAIAREYDQIVAALEKQTLVAQLLSDFSSAASSCAHAMLSNAAFIEQELALMKLSDKHRTAITEACSGLIGTKHDVISELGELQEFAGQSHSKEVQKRVDRIVNWLTEEVQRLHTVVKSLEASSGFDFNAERAFMLVSSSAVNVLNPFNDVKQSVKNYRETVLSEGQQ